MSAENDNVEIGKIINTRGENAPLEAIFEELRGKVAMSGDVKEEGFETIIVPVDSLRYTQRNVQRQLCEGSRSGEIALVRSS